MVTQELKIAEVQNNVVDVFPYHAQHFAIVELTGQKSGLPDVRELRQEIDVPVATES